MAWINPCVDWILNWPLVPTAEQTAIRGLGLQEIPGLESLHALLAHEVFPGTPYGLRRVLWQLPRPGAGMLNTCRCQCSRSRLDSGLEVCYLLLRLRLIHPPLATSMSKPGDLNCP